MQGRDFELVAGDGRTLAATHFDPNPRHYAGRAVVIASAMGVKRSLYESYAGFLADHGYPVLTFDYRGIGGSGPSRLRGFEARLRDWGSLDLAGAIDWMRHAFPEASINLVAHSVGGQVVGLAPNCLAVEGMLAVASQSGYWGHWRGTRRVGMYLLWHLLMPLTSRVLGYFPARAVGFGENLPRGVALEWAHWGRHPDYLWGRLSESERRGYGRFTGDIRAYSFSDDGYAPQSAVAAFVSFYPRARTSRRHLRPTDLARPRIGHFGFFSENVARDLWPETIDWLVRDQVPAYQSHRVR